jgi:hypothetical protein
MKSKEADRKFVFIAKKIGNLENNQHGGHHFCARKMTDRFIQSWEREKP